MAKKPLPCPTLLRLLLRYDPETGGLFWKDRMPWMQPKHRSWNARHSGKEAFTAFGGSGDGYHVGSIFGTATYAHRVAMAMINGSWPVEVDHINGDPSDNRAHNLRACTSSENKQNRRGLTVYAGRATTSHFSGVGRHADGFWRARIVIPNPAGGRGVEMNLGCYKDEECAAKAYDDAAVTYFGEFARTNFPVVG